MNFLRSMSLWAACKADIHLFVRSQRPATDSASEARISHVPLLASRSRALQFHPIANAAQTQFQRRLTFGTRYGHDRVLARC